MWLSHDLIADSVTTVGVASAKTLKKSHADEAVPSGTLRLDFDITKACQLMIDDNIWMIEIWTPLRYEGVFSSEY